MAGLDLQAIREGLAATVRECVRPEINVLPYIDDKATGVRVTVLPDPTNFVEFETTFGATGAADLLMSLYCQCPIGPIDAQIMLDELLGEGVYSLYTAITADRTLGGTVADCRVSVGSGYALVERPDGVVFVSARVSLSILLAKEV